MGGRVIVCSLSDWVHLRESEGIQCKVSRHSAVPAKYPTARTAPPFTQYFGLLIGHPALRAPLISVWVVSEVLMGSVWSETFNLNSQTAARRGWCGEQVIHFIKQKLDWELDWHSGLCSKNWHLTHKLSAWMAYLSLYEKEMKMYFTYSCREVWFMKYMPL